MNTLELESIIDHKTDKILSEYSDRYFLMWLNNRLKYKYKENDHLINKLSHIIENTAILPKKLTPSIIDKCCREHYADFDMEKDNSSNWGYTDEEKNNIKKLITDIYSTVVKIQCSNE